MMDPPNTCEHGSLSRIWILETGAYIFLRTTSPNWVNINVSSGSYMYIIILVLERVYEISTRGWMRMRFCGGLLLRGKWQAGCRTIGPTAALLITCVGKRGSEILNYLRRVKYKEGPRSQSGRKPRSSSPRGSHTTESLGLPSISQTQLSRSR